MFLATRGVSKAEDIKVEKIEYSPTAWCFLFDSFEKISLWLSIFFIIFRLTFFYFIAHCAVPRLRLTSQRLGAGGASTAVRTGDKLPNSYKLSGESLPRLRQTARYVPYIIHIQYFIHFSLLM